MNSATPSPATAPFSADASYEASGIEKLNHECFCLTLDSVALERALDGELGSDGLSEIVRERCPNMFAQQPIFVSRTALEKIAKIVQAVETVVAIPAYRERVLGSAPSISRLNARAVKGVFFGFDFHLDHGRLGLIEINTNAGGAMLNAILARAHRACCAGIADLVPTLASVERFEQSIVDMFQNEWQLTGRTHKLATIAIVDDAPKQQFLYAEFVLFQRLFERHGLRAVVTGADTLEWRDGKLWFENLAIDLVYNRLTDFYLEQIGNAALREAYAQQAVVLTPDPHAHALYADKRHLALFSDHSALLSLGVPEPTIAILLEAVPRTEIVSLDAATRLWKARRNLFFKPVAGFGSRAAYRGDKLTKRVWQEILAGDYVAQAIVTPGERRPVERDPTRSLKFDLRAYAYGGTVQWYTARLYQGQTTNFRTPGGGFAPVYSTLDAADRRPRTGHGSNHVDDEAGSETFTSYVFLIDAEGGIHAIPHALYVALAKGDASAPVLAGQTLRLADWYVRSENGEPIAIENETYLLMSFDATGKVDRSAKEPEIADGSTPPPGGPRAAWPTSEERAKMQALLFG